MTTRKHYLAWLPIISALFLLTGCNTVSIRATPYAGAPKFPPTDPAQVQILRTEPTRPHVKLGQIQAEPSSLGTDVAELETVLRQKAASLGADAAVVVVDRVQVVGAMVVNGWTGGFDEDVQARVIIVVAIKYQ